MLSKVSFSALLVERGGINKNQSNGKLQIFQTKYKN